MKILLHACCGPCAVYPVRVLREQGWDVTAYFYRHNIHPYTECRKREDALLGFAKKIDMRVIVSPGYELEEFIRGVVFRESERCRMCYFKRLEATAHIAKHGRFDAFTSTLLYSKFQRHDLIRETGEAIGKNTGITFHYQDFRQGWKEGINESRSLGMYRQQYCGCIYSEKERFFKEKGKQTN